MARRRRRNISLWVTTAPATRGYAQEVWREHGLHGHSSDVVAARYVDIDYLRVCGGLADQVAQPGRWSKGSGALLSRQASSHGTVGRTGRSQMTLRHCR
jgi:hypothetical protein